MKYNTYFLRRNKLFKDPFFRFSTRCLWTPRFIVHEISIFFSSNYNKTRRCHDLIFPMQDKGWFIFLDVAYFIVFPSFFFVIHVLYIRMSCILKYSFIDSILTHTELRYCLKAMKYNTCFLGRNKLFKDLFFRFSTRCLWTLCAIYRLWSLHI